MTAPVASADPVEFEYGSAEFLRTRPCKFVVMEQSCPYGKECFYAHTREELRHTPASEAARRGSQAQHWQGARVAIGVVEQAMLWDLAPIGTTDVVCNRASCLGNPFATRIYEPGDIVPPADDQGWRRGEHQELCAAFSEYLAAVLGDALEDGPLLPLVTQMAQSKGMSLAETWLAQTLTKVDVRSALAGLESMLCAGDRLRLLCHCRPFVQCHTEFLKAHLEARVEVLCCAAAPAVAPSGPIGWPDFLDGKGPVCAKESCGRVCRAMDPLNRNMFCTLCWIQHSEKLKATPVDNPVPAPEHEIKAALISVGDAADMDDADGDNDKEGRAECPYYAYNSCKWGKQCYYRHVKQVAEVPFCQYHLRGVCKFGDLCAFTHTVKGDEGS